MTIMENNFSNRYQLNDVISSYQRIVVFLRFNCVLTAMLHRNILYIKGDPCITIFYSTHSDSGLSFRLEIRLNTNFVCYSQFHAIVPWGWQATPNGEH